MQWPEMDQSTSNRMPTAPKPLVDALSQSNTRYHDHAPVCGHVSAVVAFQPLIKLGQSACSVDIKDRCRSCFSSCNSPLTHHYLKPSTLSPFIYYSKALPITPLSLSSRPTTFSDFDRRTSRLTAVNAVIDGLGFSMVRPALRSNSSTVNVTLVRLSAPDLDTTGA